MTNTERERADAHLEKALEETGARDPRQFYRDRLRELRERDKGAYEKGVRYFEETLVPAVASGRVEPLGAWTEYGRHLAELTAPGRTVAVDPTGRSRPYEPPPTPDGLVLHLPHAGGGWALVVGLPPRLSEAQRATYDWLVAGRQRLQGGGDEGP